MKAKVISFCALFLCLLLITPDLLAQSKRKIDKMLQKAEEYLITANYNEVTNICEEVIANNPEENTAHYLLGRSYYQLNEIERALYHYEKISEKDRKHFSDYFLNTSLTLQSLSQYEKALNNINQYLDNQKFGGRDNLVYQKAMIIKTSILMAMEGDEQNREYKFELAHPPISSMQDDYSIAFAPNAEKLIVNIENQGNPNNVKYIFEDGHWKNIYEHDEFEYLNTRDAEGIGTMTQDGKRFVFSRCDKNGTQCKLWISEKINGIWSRPSPLPENVNALRYETIDPAFSPQGDTLFFSSNRIGGQGNFDLWYTLKGDDGEWSAPINMGTKVNTAFDEASPFLANSDNTLYFSSDGHPGYGKMDVFAFNFSSKKILNPGKPINSGYDDKSFIVEENKGYLVSNRPGGVGKYDVYRFNMPEQEKKSNWNGEKMERLYAAVFAAQLYDIPVKLMPSDHEMFTAIDEETRNYLTKRAKENIESLSQQEIEQIKDEDHIIYTSLKKGEKELVDYVVTAYFSDIKSVEVYKRYSEMYNALDLEDKRKYDRVIANRIHANERIKMLAKTNKENKPLDSKSVEQSQEIKETKPKIQPTEERIVESLNRQEPIIPQEETYASANFEEKAPSSASVSEKSNDEKFANFLGIEHSVKYYQQLPFKERKRVDRIVAIRLVNEQYTLNPILTISDQQYYSTLSRAEKETINRLKLYFQSWSEYQQKKNLQNGDLDYLESLPADKKEIITRLIVRRGIGVDVDNFVKFSGTDWQQYKRYTANDIENIKKVASLLKSKNQVFNVALAYAEPEGGSFNTQRNLIDNPGELKANEEVGNDPITFAASSVKFESLFFDPQSSKLRKEVIVALNDLVSVFNKNPSLRFKLSALSADAETEAQNEALSAERLNSVKTYLKQMGIPEEKISTKTFTEEHIEDIWSFEHMISRRVDVFAEGNTGNVTSDYTTYMIQPGNTLYSLSKANDMTVDELKETNGLDDTKIYAYHPMRVKKNAELKNEYMVESSSGLYYQEVKLRKLSDHEEESDIPDEVKESIERGETLYSIDVNKPAEEKNTLKVHVVGKGEKLKHIATYYNITVEDIMQANNLDKKKVREGQRLVIEE